MQSLNKNKKLFLLLLLLVVSMIGLSYASVPLYRLFCQVTGFGGTPQINNVSPSGMLGKRKITVSFDANISDDLNWNFEPLQNNVMVNTGENKLVYYMSENLSNDDLTGMAIFNVTPHKAAKYFSKVHCFCFEQQTISPGEKVEMPVSFYIDSRFDDDPEMDDVNLITLSYTFFKDDDQI